MIMQTTFILSQTLMTVKIYFSSFINHGSEIDEQRYVFFSSAGVVMNRKRKDGNAQ